MKLYALNLKVSESLYSPIQGLEICLRNSLNRVLIEKFGIDWIEERRVSLEPPQQEQIQNAIDSLRREGKPLSNGSLVAELSIGFWVGLLGPRYETSLWRGLLRKAFPNRPKGRERKEVQGALNAIRRLRNRIAHHERILRRNVVSDHGTIVAVVGWMCLETQDWVQAHSSFKPELLKR
jgi:hypothetical protein